MLSTTDRVTVTGLRSLSRLLLLSFTALLYGASLATGDEADRTFVDQSISSTDYSTFGHPTHSPTISFNRCAFQNSHLMIDIGRRASMFEPLYNYAPNHVYASVSVTVSGPNCVFTSSTLSIDGTNDPSGSPNTGTVGYVRITGCTFVDSFMLMRNMRPDRRWVIEIDGNVITRTTDVVLPLPFAVAQPVFNVPQGTWGSFNALVYFDTIQLTKQSQLSVTNNTFSLNVPGPSRNAYGLWFGWTLTMVEGSTLTLAQNRFNISGSAAAVGIQHSAAVSLTTGSRYAHSDSIWTISVTDAGGTAPSLAQLVAPLSVTGGSQYLHDGISASLTSASSGAFVFNYDSVAATVLIDDNSAAATRGSSFAVRCPMYPILTRSLSSWWKVLRNSSMIYDGNAVSLTATSGGYTQGFELQGLAILLDGASRLGLTSNRWTFATGTGAGNVWLQSGSTVAQNGSSFAFRNETLVAVGTSPDSHLSYLYCQNSLSLSSGATAGIDGVTASFSTPGRVRLMLFTWLMSIDLGSSLFARNVVFTVPTASDVALMQASGPSLAVTRASTMVLQNVAMQATASGEARLLFILNSAAVVSGGSSLLLISVSATITATSAITLVDVVSTSLLVANSSSLAIRNVDANITGSGGECVMFYYRFPPSNAPLTLLGDSALFMSTIRLFMSTAAPVALYAHLQGGLVVDASRWTLQQSSWNLTSTAATSASLRFANSPIALSAAASLWVSQISVAQTAHMSSAFFSMSDGSISLRLTTYFAYDRVSGRVVSPNSRGVVVFERATVSDEGGSALRLPPPTVCSASSWAPCTATEYVHRSSDTDDTCECRPLVPCSLPSYYAAVAPTEYSNWGCLMTRQCILPYIEFVPPSTFTDRVCGICSWNKQYYNGSACVPLTTCDDAAAKYVRLTQINSWYGDGSIFLTELQPIGVDGSVIPATIRASTSVPGYEPSKCQDGSPLTYCWTLGRGANGFANQYIELEIIPLARVAALRIDTPYMGEPRISDIRVDVKDSFNVVRESFPLGVYWNAPLPLSRIPTEYEVQPAQPRSDRVCAPLVPCTASQYRVAFPTPTSNWDCRNWTECTAEQYQITAPTATTDRQCTALTVCSSDQYQSTAPTPTSDRRCRALTVCSPTEYVSVPATATSDRVCAALTPCNPNTQYIVSYPTAATNWVCRAFTVCSAVQYQSVAPTATSDRQCANLTRCNTMVAAVVKITQRSNWFVSLQEINPFSLSGTNLRQSLSFIGASPSGAFLQACIDGQYNLVPDANGNYCRSGSAVGAYIRLRLLTPQPLSSVFVGNTVDSQNAVNALTCNLTLEDVDGFVLYSSPMTDNATQWFVVPAATEYESVPATATSDRVCRPLTTCALGQHETLAPTATRDRVCQWALVCSVGEFMAPDSGAVSGWKCLPLTECNASTEYEVTPPTRVSNRACAALTPCNASEFIVAAANATSNWVCHALTECSPSQIETVPPTATSDRVCADVGSNGTSARRFGGAAWTSPQHIVSGSPTAASLYPSVPFLALVVSLLVAAVAVAARRGRRTKAGMVTKLTGDDAAGGDDTGSLSPSSCSSGPTLVV